MYPTTSLYSADVISHLCHFQQTVRQSMKKNHIFFPTKSHQTFLSSSVSCGGVAVKGCRDLGPVNRSCPEASDTCFVNLFSRLVMQHHSG